MNFKRLTILGIVTLTIMAAGCHWIGGGGWLDGLNGGKAHFGFEAECHEEDGTYYFHQGDFQYMDKSAGVRFHGEIQWTLGIFGFEGSCAELTAELAEISEGGWNNSVAELSGECRTQPKGHTGTFTVYVEDNGTPGMAGDYIEISTTGCGADGGDYSHSGYLGGGNIWSEMLSE